MTSILARQLSDGADFLDMCARLDKTGELDWTKPIIERRFTIMETMRNAAKEIDRLRASLRVNGLRQGMSDAEIDKVLTEEVT